MIPQPASPRPDPLQLLLDQERSRLPWLLPVRHSRMARSAFHFHGGAAVLTAADLARLPCSGPVVQLCGDAHLLNFGIQACADGRLLIAITDFEQTHPGPYDWDVQRLGTSLLLAARSIGLDAAMQERLCRRALRAYARTVAACAAMPALALWELPLELGRRRRRRLAESLRRQVAALAQRHHRRDGRPLLRPLCERDGEGGLRLRHDPPWIWRDDQPGPPGPGAADWRSWLEAGWPQYRLSLHAHTRALLDRFRLVDVAGHSLGIGSVGSRSAIALLIGETPADVLLLQCRQAEPSVLADWLTSPAEGVSHPGERLVQGQRLLQARPDPLLGWSTGPAGEPCHWRCLSDARGRVDLDRLDAEGLSDYGRLCARSLARAHARSGDRLAIHAHIGRRKAFARALLASCLGHAEQAEQDHRRFLEGIASGVISSSAPP